MGLVQGAGVRASRSHLKPRILRFVFGAERVGSLVPVVKLDSWVQLGSCSFLGFCHILLSCSYLSQVFEG